MDQALSRAEAKELMGLLGLPEDSWGNVPLITYRFRQKSKIYHPDKGGNEETMKRMTELYSRMQNTLQNLRSSNENENMYPPGGQYGTPAWEQWWEEFNQPFEDDLTCNESFNCSDDEGTSASQKRKFPDSSTQNSTPPKKNKPADPTDFPAELETFLSHAVFSNKTSNCFCIYTTMEKGNELYTVIGPKFKSMFISCHSYNTCCLLFMILAGKHRVSALKNFCSALCSISFVLVKSCLKPYECYYRMCSSPFSVTKQSRPEGLSQAEFMEQENSKPTVNWQQICEFAVQFNCEDPLLLMGIYLDFSESPDNCEKCRTELKHHNQFHEKEHNNAKLFRDSKTQKTLCQQACDWVCAKRRVLILESTREDLLVIRFKQVLKEMQDIAGEVEILRYMAGVAWLSLLFNHFDDIVLEIIRTMVINTPKRRYFLFKGPINSGKTTVAAAILDLLGGRTLNINCPPEKVNFELGCAIDEFMVVFEDVKGQTEGKTNLTSGMGMNNLDSLRDHLDGCVKVNLEKKHLNKRSQIFPPGIITMNEYNVPLTILARMVKVINFRPKHYLKKSLEVNNELLHRRIVQSGKTLLMLLMWWQPVKVFHSSIHEDVKLWKDTLTKYVSIGMFHDIQKNIQNGEDPLKNILICEDTENNETQDSAFCTQDSDNE
uniref:Large T antigen n=1 Tax=STL polyomavirus TaxID=1277649 RepID=L7REU2_9POLY|nr:large T antigen [STL polyomavirus]